MTDEAPLPPSPDVPLDVPGHGPSPEELAALLVASGLGASPPPPSPQTKRALRRKLMIAALIAAAGLGASVMSCVGQSFSYRQARALEGIEQQLKDIRASCAATPVEPAKSP